MILSELEEIKQQKIEAGLPDLPVNPFAYTLVEPSCVPEILGMQIQDMDLRIQQHKIQLEDADEIHASKLRKSISSHLDAKRILLACKMRNIQKVDSRIQTIKVILQHMLTADLSEQPCQTPPFE